MGEISKLLAPHRLASDLLDVSVYVHIYSYYGFGAHLNVGASRAPCGKFSEGTRVLLVSLV